LEAGSLRSERVGAHIPFFRKVNYGVGIFGTTALIIFQTSFVLFFYTEVVGLDVRLTGLALLVGRIWDAVTDPAMGNISDRTKLRLGRRRPYMLYGAVPLAISYIALWTPPVGWSDSLLFVYLLITYLAFNTFITVVNIPYTALGGELTTDYHERTRLMVARMVFQMLGWYAGAAGVWLNRVLVERATGAGGYWKALLTFREGYAITSLIFAAASVITTVWTVLSVREDRSLQTQAQPGQLRAFLQTLKNRSFRLLMIAFLGISVFEMMGFAFFVFLIGYWYYSGDLEAAYANLSKLLLPLLLVSFPAFVFWSWASQRAGKKKPFLIGLAAVAVITALNFVMITPHMPWLFWPWVVLFGFAISCTNLLTLSMIPDIVDEDELITGARREGSFFGMHTFAQKLAGALGAALAAFSLDLIGFQEGAAQQSDSTVYWIRAIYAFMRAGGFLLSFAVLLRFPLTPERVGEIRRMLDTRAAARDAALWEGRVPPRP
jgi:GPH family glycoside/pentoside/hexuronide:cation symporter